MTSVAKEIARLTAEIQDNKGQFSPDIDADGTEYRPQVANVRTLVAEVDKDGQPTGKKVVKKVPTIGWMASKGNQSAWGADRALARQNLAALTAPPPPAPKAGPGHLRTLSTQEALERANREIATKKAPPAKKDPAEKPSRPTAIGTHKHRTKKSSQKE